MGHKPPSGAAIVRSKIGRFLEYAIELGGPPALRPQLQLATTVCDKLNRQALPFTDLSDTISEDGGPEQSTQHHPTNGAALRA